MYNRYRHRNYNLTRSQARKYAQSMADMSEEFDKMPDWSLSSRQDSCYKMYDKYELRISNHSAAYAHNLDTSYLLLVNVKKPKLEFINFIKENLSTLIDKIDTLDLAKYRYINVVNNQITCFYKGYKTKKDIFTY